jgi:RNA polymerase sigma-70 factor (ECF subfamily)
VSIADTTCWTVIRGAAEGRPKDRDEFARRYEPVVRAYLATRWRDSDLRGEIDDCAQEVFLDCFREGGALERAEEGRPGGFRAFLYGVARNVALRAERERGRKGVPLDSAFDAPAREEALSDAFDRAWAQSLLRQAARLMEARGRAKGADAQRRVELLRLRFGEEMPIRDIAKLWNADAARLHHEYATARDEFRAALKDVVSEHQPGDAVAEAERLIACFR